MANHLHLPVVVTPSRAQGGTRCHRKHVLGDVLCKSLIGPGKPSLEFGTLIHSGAAAHWLGEDWASVIEQEWETRFEMTEVSQKDVSLPMANAMMEYYIAHASLAGPLQDAADDWKLVDVEQRYEVPLQEHRLSFQMDRTVYSAEQDWLVVVDTKTAGRLDWRWDRQWPMSLQMKDYKFGAQTVFDTGGRVDIVVEGLHKHVPSALRYFVCPEWSPAMIGEAAFNTYRVAEQDSAFILQSMGEDGVPDLAKAEEIAVRMTAFNEGECFSYNSECPFHRICTADLDERTGILRGEYEEKLEEDY